MKSSRYISACFIMVLCALFLCGMRVVAADQVKEEKEINLTIQCQNENTILVDEEFKVYLVMEVSGEGTWSVTEPFKQYHVNFDDISESEWRTLASTLEGYVLRDAIVPTANGRTNEQGILKLPNGGEPLVAGLYLILGTPYVCDDGIYMCAPSMVLLPEQGMGQEDWDYDVTVNPKFEFIETPDEGKIYRKVLKAWDDKGHEDSRPETVKIQLLKDGILYDTVALSKENNWRHTWDSLDNKCHWAVVEEKNGDLVDYEVRIVKEGSVFVITNIYTPEDEEEEPSEPEEPSEEPEEEKPKLPQLGQLWWPIPILVAAGLLFIILGVLRLREDYEK